MDGNVVSELLGPDRDRKRIVRRRTLAFLRRRPGEPQTFRAIVNGVLDVSRSDSVRAASAVREYIRDDCRTVLRELVAEGVLEEHPEGGFVYRFS